ncbi:luciferase family protein [Actinocrispum sp. NPDC049592]|uniref:luciferase domain-containing protein n=1 Tax=Actinocrispum sp. NPDC049592 TaxID=3154835 RepID=UPI0034150F91
MSEWLRELILAVGDVVECPSRYKDDLGYWVGGREIAHLEAENVLDLRMTRAAISARRAELKADPRVELRSGSDWLTVRVAGPEDAAFVTDLVRQAAAANR